jgi:hypothetical protein
MMKLRGAAPAQEASAQLADVATGAFRQLGDASRQLMQLQAQAAAIVLMDSTNRYAEALEAGLRNFGWQHWARLQRSQLRSVGEPLQAWMESVLGLQAVLAAAWMQALALAAFPERSPEEVVPTEERRTNSVVIQFPDRRRSAGA